MISRYNIIVVIFTYRSPFGLVPEFIEDEIPFWRDAKKVVIISLAEHDEATVSIGHNGDAYAVCPSRSFLAKLLNIILGLLHIDVFSEFLLNLWPMASGFLQRLKNFVIHIQATERYMRGAKRILAAQLSDQSTLFVLYSYWCGSATHAAIRLKEELFNNRALVITRAHGSDLYEYANKNNYLPLRKQILKSCDGIYPISEHGVDYLINYWKCDASKVELARLGIPDHFTGRYPIRNKRFHIVSCSYISSVKRVHLIAEALSTIDDVNIHWTHIGGGLELAKLQQLCGLILKDKSNIQYKLCGNMAHSEVIEMFRTQNINLLVNVSSSEGIPVSFMEAHCSGIPILAPDVGGVREIVEHGVNGRVMPHNFTVRYLKQEILAIIGMNIREYINMCMSARKSWCMRYSSQNNYSAFILSIYKLCARELLRRT